MKQKTINALKALAESLGALADSGMIEDPTGDLSATAKNVMHALNDEIPDKAIVPGEVTREEFIAAIGGSACGCQICVPSPLDPKTPH